MIYLLKVGSAKLHQVRDVIYAHCHPLAPHHERHAGGEVARAAAHVQGPHTGPQVLPEQLQRVCVHVRGRDGDVVAECLGRVHVGVVLDVVASVYQEHSVTHFLGLDDVIGEQGLHHATVVLTV